MSYVDDVKSFSVTLCLNSITGFSLHVLNPKEGDDLYQKQNANTSAVVQPDFPSITKQLMYPPYLLVYLHTHLKSQ